MSDYVYSEDPYQHVVRVVVTIGRPFVKIHFGGLAPNNQITFSGVGLSGGGQGNDAWGIVPFGGSVSVDVPVPTDDPPLLQNALIGLFLYEDSTPGALEAAIAAAVGGAIEDVPGPAYGTGVLFNNTAGYTGTLESIVTYSGLVYVLDDAGRLVSEVQFLDPGALIGTMVPYDPPLHPLL